MYARKRQRRQAAAVVVQSLWSNNSNASAANRKSTAQPRPHILIPPRGIGPIVDPNQHDVLCGRGGRINSHSGNIQFREMVQERKKEYLAKTTKKLEKAHIAARIVREIREMDPPGRFLKEDRGTGLWFDIGDQKAIKKSGQALREDAPDIRVEIDDDSSGDDKAKTGAAQDMKIDVNPLKKVPKTPPAPPQTMSHPQLKQAPPPVQNHAMPVAQSADRGPQHIPSGGNPFPEVPRGLFQLSAEEHAAKVAMPPPFSQAQQQSSQKVRTIPIQAPPSQNTYSMPMYGGINVSGGRSVSKNSRHVMQTLAEHEASSQQPPPPDVAFNKAFFPPPTTSSALSGGHTMSSMSDISNPISSTVPGSGYGANQSQMQSKFPNNDAVRISQLKHVRNSEAAQSNRSDMTYGSMRSMGSLSLTPSATFPDSASFTDQDSYKAIMDGDGDFASGIMSVSSNKYSVSSAGPDGGFEQNAGAWTHPAAARSRNASTHSARSLSMMSVGTITSAQYASRLGNGGGGESSLIGGGSSLIGMDDVRSNVSDMSSDFKSLDLANSFR